MTNIPDRMKMFDNISHRARHNNDIPIIDLLNQVSAISRTRSCKTAEKIFDTQKSGNYGFKVSEKIFPNKIFYEDFEEKNGENRNFEENGKNGNFEKKSEENFGENNFIFGSDDDNYEYNDDKNDTIQAENQPRVKTVRLEIDEKKFQKSKTKTTLIKF